MSLQKQKLAIITTRNSNVDDIRFTVGTAAKDRSPPINMKYVTKRDEKGNEISVEPFQIKLPKLSYRLMTREDKDGNETYTLSGTLKGVDPFGQEHSTGDDETSALYNFLLDLENKIKTEAKKANVKWFGKKNIEAVIDASFKRIISVSKNKEDKEPNGKYPPSILIKVQSYKNKQGEMVVNFEDLVDESGKSIPLTYESIPDVFYNGIEAALTITGSIYTISGTNYGVTWRMNMGKIYSQNRMRAADVFADDEETTTTSNVNIASNTQQSYEEQQPEEEEETRPTTPVKQVTQSVAPNAPARKKRSAAV
jgi:hypothetical protein